MLSFCIFVFFTCLLFYMLTYLRIFVFFTWLLFYLLAYLGIFVFFTNFFIPFSVFLVYSFFVSLFSLCCQFKMSYCCFNISFFSLHTCFSTFTCFIPLPPFFPSLHLSSARTPLTSFSRLPNLSLNKCISLTAPRSSLNV